MAQRPYWYAESLSESSTTSTSYVNKLTTSITPNASKAVAVFFFCEVGQSNTSAGVYARLTIGGVEKCFGSFVVKEASSPRDYNPVSGFAIIPASGSPSAQTVNVDYCPESGLTGYIRNVRIVAIELGANDYYDEETSRQTRTGSTALANVSGLGITPASGSYIVFASTQSDMNADTDGAQVAITSDGVTATEPYISSVRDNVGIGTTYPIQRLNAWNRTASGNGDGACSGSETLSVGFAPNTSSNTMGIQNVRILALNTADFDNVYVNVLTADSTGTQTSYQDALTLTASTPAANPHLSIAVWSHEGSSTSVSTYTQFNDDGDVLNERIREAYVTTNDRGDNTGGSGRIEDWTTSSRDLKLQRKSETSSATARLKRGALIAAFDLGSAGSSTQNVTANSIASTAAFGSPTLTRGAVSVSANSIAPTAAFGSPTVSNAAPAQDLTASSIAPTAAFGSPVLTVGAVTVTANAIAPTAAFGAATVTTGAVSVSANSISSTVAFGSPTLALNVTPSGIASTAAFGSPTLTVGAATVTANSIAPTAAFGQPTISTASAVVSPNSIAPTTAFGAPTVTPGAVSVSTNSIASTAVLGSPSVGLAIVVDGLPSTVAFGSPTLTTVVGIQPDGIGSTVQFGVPSLVFGQTLGVDSIGPSVAFGLPDMAAYYKALPISGRTISADPARGGSVSASPIGGLTIAAQRGSGRTITANPISGRTI